MNPNEPIEPIEPKPISENLFGLLDAGDPRFVAALRADLAALRADRDAPALARFAAAWYADTRPMARQLLLAYLDEPPNAPGHEGLVKRLFKLAEAAGDDEVMARFLVLCDRLILRRPPVRSQYRHETFATREEAEARGNEWLAEGARGFTIRPQRRLTSTMRFGVIGRFAMARLTTRGTTLPRVDWQAKSERAPTRDQLARRRWFTVATRRHLQRRVWRYFRNLGRTSPERYRIAAVAALQSYRDSELPDGIALLDHHGLTHLLFGASPVLRPHASGWNLAPRQTLAELAPAPAFEAAWRERPDLVVGALARSPAAIVARWVVRWIEADAARFATQVPIAAWVDRCDSPHPEIVALSLQILQTIEPERLRAEIPPGRWAVAVESAAPASQAAVGDFVARLIPPDLMARADAARLAIHPAEPVALLGWGWLEGRGGATVPPGSDPEQDADLWLGLLRAAHGPLRPAIIRGVVAALRDRPGDRARWVWTILNSPHGDARAAGWAWFQADDALWANPAVWDNLLGSPYPDIQAACATGADRPVAADSARLDRVRAAVLLRPHGASRVKPAVIRQVVARLGAIPSGPDLEIHAGIGLLAAVVRSARGPERRAALAGLVRLAERRPEWRERVEQAVPALLFAAEPGIVPALTGQDGTGSDLI